MKSYHLLTYPRRGRMGTTYRVPPTPPGVGPVLQLRRAARVRRPARSAKPADSLARVAAQGRSRQVFRRHPVGTLFRPAALRDLHFPLVRVGVAVARAGV